jgi:hypothetical protein
MKNSCVCRVYLQFIEALIRYFLHCENSAAFANVCFILLTASDIIVYTYVHENES